MDLKTTVEGKDPSRKIYFDAQGNHYFNVHEYKGDKYARINKSSKVDEDSPTKKITIKTPVESTKIVEIKTVGDILGIVKVSKSKKEKEVSND